MGLLGGKKKKSKSPAPQQKREQTPPKKSKKPETPKKGKSAPAAAPAAARQEEEQFVGAIPEGSPLSKAEIANRIVCSREPQSLFELGITPNGVGITLRYAYVSQRGYYPDDLYKANQDAFKISTKFNQSDKPQMLLGVFDGHGGEGDRCSYFVRDKIEVELADQMKKQPKDFGKAYSAAFTSLGRKIHEQEEFDDSMSGTTAIAAFFHGTHVTIANIGDSRAMVGKKKKGKVVAHSLSVDQTPYRKDERERIKKAGGVVMSMDMLDGTIPFHENWGVNLGEETDDSGDPPRVWAPGQSYPGCAFTRSIGDAVGEELGVTPEPEISTLQLSERDEFIVLASDGVWEFLTNQSVCDMVASFSSPLDACRAVVSESYRLWLQFDERTDDITMITAYIDRDTTDAVLMNEDEDDAAMGGGVTGGAAGLGAAEMRPVRRGLSKEKKKAMAIMTKSASDPDEDLSSWVAEVIPKTEQEIERIERAVKANFLFQHLHEAQIKTVYDVMKRREVHAGDVVIRQGEEGDWFYVVDDGDFSVSIEQNGQSVEIMQYTTAGGRNPCFGELALMYSKPRAATVVAETDGALWAMDRRSFRAILSKSSSESLIRTLRSVKILSSLKVGQLQRLTDKLSEITYKVDDFIITQGDSVGNSLYLLSEGRVTITRKEDMADDRPAKFVMQLGQGSYFGERALLHSEPRAANVIAATPTVKVLAISKQTFEEVLGPLQQIIDDDRARREALAQQQQKLKEDEGLGGVTVGDFSFQGVTCVSDPVQYALCSIKGKALFTVKCMAKAAVVRLGLTERVIEETALLTTVMEPHRMVPLLLTTHQDDDFLYTVIKSRVSVDLATLLGDAPFEDAASQFYTASMAIAIAHLHKQDLIFRNLTTDSVHVDDKGYVQLVDTRHSIKAEPTPTDFCGYPHYLSPEQVSGQGHGIAVDYWALGIVTYEMVTGGSNPWITGDPASDGEVGVYSRISAHTLEALTLPAGVKTYDPDALVQTLNDLLHPDPTERLSINKNMRESVWLSFFGWKDLEAGAMRGPHAKEAAQAVQKAVQEAKKPDLGSGTRESRRASSGDLQLFADFGMAFEDNAIDDAVSMINLDTALSA